MLAILVAAIAGFERLPAEHAGYAERDRSCSVGERGHSEVGVGPGPEQHGDERACGCKPAQP